MKNIYLLKANVFGKRKPNKIIKFYSISCNKHSIISKTFNEFIKQNEILFKFASKLNSFMGGQWCMEFRMKWFKITLPVQTPKENVNTLCALIIDLLV